MRVNTTKRLTLLLLLCLMQQVFFSSVLPAAQTEDPKEYAVKAAFIYNFSKFVDWPDSAMHAAEFQVCVLGKDPFAGSLEEVLGGKAVKEKKVALNRLNSVSESSGCQILYISTSESRKMGEILGALQNTPILTVGETEAFNQQGGIIQFIVKEEKLRFSVNNKIAEQTKLKISSQLLKLAVSE